LRVYETRPRKDKRAVDLISDTFSCGTAAQMRLATPSKNISIEAISRSQKVSRSRHVALPAKMNLHESALSGSGHERSEAD